MKESHGLQQSSVTEQLSTDVPFPQAELFVGINTSM